MANDTTPNALATDPARLEQLFGSHQDLVPLWIAEPYVELAPEIRNVLGSRGQAGWYGYEARPSRLREACWRWMEKRHGWDGSDLLTSVSPSIGTSIGVLLEQFTAPGDGVILQPPVFTDFKPLIIAAKRSVVRNSLVLTNGRYQFDYATLEARAAEPSTTAMILCNPHNPVGRLWSAAELEIVAEICASHNVLIIADEIHADLALPGNAFTPFAGVAAGTAVKWAALHGPIKTFGLAGVCDTLLITDNDEVSERYREESSRLHLTRNNVFALAAFDAAYGNGEAWLNSLLALVEEHVDLLDRTLPDPLRIVRPQATYLAWLDLRGLGLEVPALARWLTDAGVALSPGHWFGREGAGFARMTIAAPTRTIREAVDRLAAAV